MGNPSAVVSRLRVKGQIPHPKTPCPRRPFIVVPASLDPGGWQPASLLLYIAPR
jgi:hypothetical protein